VTETVVRVVVEAVPDMMTLRVTPMQAQALSYAASSGQSPWA